MKTIIISALLLITPLMFSGCQSPGDDGIEFTDPFFVPETDPQPVEIEIRPAKNQWRYGETITGTIVFHNRGEGPLGLHLRSLSSPYLLDSNGKSPPRVPITTFVCGGCFISTVKVLQPGEAYEKDFRISTDPEIEGNPLLQNGSYSLNHQGLQASPHNCPTTVHRASIRIHHAPEDARHMVSEGETLWSISKQYYGTGTLYTTLLEHNKQQISSAKKLQTGTRLLIPNLNKVASTQPKVSVP